MENDSTLDLFGGAVPPPPPEDVRPKVWSVSQVNRAVRGLLEASVDPLWVGGEVAGWTRSRAGHCYFGLKDERAQLRCVMFGREAAQLPTDPEEGMQVRVFGELTLYEAKGDYQLVARQLEAEGAEGLWRLAFEKLRAKLEAEGLLDPARKRPLPRVPGCVGIVTSRDGAALEDILSVIGRRAPWTRVVLRATKVQGEGAGLEIARALADLGASGIPDVIIVGRGGGAVEDLWAFNEEPVARAIAACPVPVVSAVGHEIDFTISDLVADLRAPTPSAAAEAVVPDAQVVLSSLRRSVPRLGRALGAVAERRRAAVDQRVRRLERAIERRVLPVRQSLARAAVGFERAALAGVERRHARLATLGARLDALSPLATLRRGYAVARTPEGRVLRGTADFPQGLRFHLRVADGTIGAEAQGLVETEEPRG